MEFPLANHFDSPDSESIFGISQDPPIYAHAFLSQVWILPHRAMGSLALVRIIPL